MQKNQQNRYNFAETGNTLNKKIIRHTTKQMVRQKTIHI